MTHSIADAISFLDHDKLNRALVAATIPIGLAIQGVAAPYPPSGPGNAPKTWQSSAGGHRVNLSWYQRGYGPRWVVKSGAIHGRQTSETLGRKWGVQPTSRGAVVRNTASYAGFAHAAAHQTAPLQRIGWVTDRTAVESVMRSGIANTILSHALAHAFSQAGA